MQKPSWVKRIPKKLIIFVAIGLTIYTAWNIAYPSGSWHYKLTVEVETPEGLKTGSAVREISVYTLPRTLPEAGVVFRSVRGEAAVVDLGRYGQVFALLKTRQGIDGAHYIAENAFRPNISDVYKRTRYYLNLKNAKKILDVADYPRFVLFRDPNDPKSVEAIAPNKFNSSFGEGVNLKSVTIEVTDSAITTGIVEQYLPWLPQQKGKKGTLGGGESISEDPTGTWLTGAEFSKGIYW